MRGGTRGGRGRDRTREERGDGEGQELSIYTRDRKEGRQEKGKTRRKKMKKGRTIEKEMNNE